MLEGLRSLEKRVYKQLDAFYSAGSGIISDSAPAPASEGGPETYKIAVYKGDTSVSADKKSIGNHRWAHEAISHVETDFLLKRSREFTLQDPLTAIECVGSQLFLAATATHSVVAFNTDLQRQQAFPNLHLNRITVLQAIRAGADGHITSFLSGSDDHLIKFTSYERGVTVQTFVGNNGAITDISYNDAYDIFVSANRAGQIYMWSKQAPRPLCQYTASHTDSTFTSLRFVSGTSTFAVASGTFMHVWDIRYTSAPVVAANILPATAEQLVFSGYNCNLTHGTSQAKCDFGTCASEWIVLTGKGVFRVSLGTQPHVIQSRCDIKSSTVHCMLPCMLQLDSSSDILTQSLLLVSKRGAKEKASVNDNGENNLPLTIIDQGNLNRQFVYTCKRAHTFNTHVLSAYLPPDTWTADQQGSVLMASSSDTLHLYKLGLKPRNK